jgi:hypothetical protein
MNNISQLIKKFTSLLFSNNDFTIVKTRYGYTAIRNFNIIKKVVLFYQNIMTVEQTQGQLLLSKNINL